MKGRKAELADKTAHQPKPVSGKVTRKKGVVGMGLARPAARREKAPCGLHSCQRMIRERSLDGVLEEGPAPVFNVVKTQQNIAASS